MGWMIEYQGATLREDDVLMAHLTLANTLLETTGWESANPMQSPEALTVWVSITISLHSGAALDQTMLFVQQMRLQELIGCYKPEAPPKTAPVSPSEPRNGAPGTNGAQLSPEQQAARQAVLDQIVRTRK